MNNKLLLTTVFKPFGVDDFYGRSENLPELMMAQITRAQGLFNYRIWHANSGLHLLAANCDCKTTVLEWPSIDQFVEEITVNNYEYLGISFIPCTLLKMREMVQICRKYSPQTKLIIGGQGTLIENLQSIVNVDFICIGEGISFLRELFGKKTIKKIIHPIVTSKIVQFLGVPIRPMINGQIVSGLGCKNGCDFCVSSAFFNCAYKAFISTGKEFIEIITKNIEKHDIHNFWVIDENFLQNRKRAESILQKIRSNINLIPNYQLDMVWSSYENIIAYSPEELAEMGISMIWLGYESKYSKYSKNAGINLSNLIDNLSNYGISTLISTVLFYDFHNKDILEDDIDTVIKSGLTYPQFLPLSALPGTKLYNQLKKENRLLDTIPWEEKTVLNTGTHIHPHYPIHQQKQCIISAYEKEYAFNGPSVLRAFKNQLKGYNTFIHSKNAVLQKRAIYLKSILEQYGIWVLSSVDIVEAKHKDLALQCVEGLRIIFGEPYIDRIRPASAFLLKNVKRALKKRDGNPYEIIQPKMRKTIYESSGIVKYQIDR